MVCAAFGSENWEEGGGGSSFTDDGGKEGWCRSRRITLSNNSTFG